MSSNKPKKLNSNELKEKVIEDTEKLEKNTVSSLSSENIDNTAETCIKNTPEENVQTKADDVSENVTEKDKVSENIENVSAAEKVSEDINDISQATSDALKNVDKVAYSDNLKERKSSSKSIRALDIQGNSQVEPSSELSQNNREYTLIKKKSNKTIIIGIICSVVLLLIIGILSTIFALLNSTNSNIISGVSIYGIDVSKLSEQEALEKVKNIIDEKLSTEIILKHGDYETTVFPEQFEISLDIESAVKVAVSKGRQGNIFQNNFEIISACFNCVNIIPSFSYSEETMDSLITELNDNLPDRVVDSNYYIDGNNLIITSGIDGYKISADELKSDIIYYINNITCTQNVIDIPVISTTAVGIDLDRIYYEIYKAPVDAYYTTNPYVVYPEVYGVDFAISIEEVKTMLATPAESYTIPLKVLSPNVTTNDIGTEAFPDLLASFSTTYSTSNRNRSTNIALAASKINGIVIMPGETFSYNETVGQRTAAAGFKSAAVYSNGEVTTGIGGGICQVSSTLYNAVLLANLGIVERTNHGFNPGYVQAGRDATVSWGGPDFKFKNTRDYPVKIVCSGTGGKINFQIFGLKSDDEYEVVIQASTVSTIAYKTIYQNTTTLAAGQTKVSQSGSNGCKTVTYRILKKNGVEVSRELLSRDTYNPHNKIVLVGV